MSVEPKPLAYINARAVRHLIDTSSDQTGAVLHRAKGSLYGEEDLPVYGFNTISTLTARVAELEAALRDAVALLEQHYPKPARNGQIARARAALAGHAPAEGEAKVPVAWQRRFKFSSTPGEIPQWEQCSEKEATGHFDRQPGYEYRPLYAHPPAQEPKP